MNWKKSSTLGYITENYSIQSSALNTLRNPIRLGTQQPTSRMQFSQWNNSTTDAQKSPEWVNLVLISNMGSHEGWGDPVNYKIKVTPTSPEESWMDDALEAELIRAGENRYNGMS